MSHELLKNYKGSSYLLRAHGKGGASVTTFSFLSAPPPPEKIAGGFQQAGEKEGGWGEGIFARLLRAEGANGWEAFPPFCNQNIKAKQFLNPFKRKGLREKLKIRKENCFALLAELRRAETRSGANQAFFVQNRFALRSVIATNSDILKIEERLVARSPRLRRVSLRKKPCISELNRKGGQIQIQFFGKANGGSAPPWRGNKQSLFPIFSFPPKAEYKASFLIPRFCAVGVMAKGDIIN